MAETGRELADLAAELVTYPQMLVNVRVREKRPIDDGAGDRRRRWRASKPRSAGAAALLVRYSGTEPLLRIMIEGEDQATIAGVGRGDRASAVRSARQARLNARRESPTRSSDHDRLSVNVNKVATLRNSRGGARAERDRGGARRASTAGAPGITVHPRADERHITPADVARDRRRCCAPRSAGRVEFNIEGDPRPDLIELVLEVRPDQCTLVPVRAGRDHEPGRLAARTRRPSALRRRSSRGCSGAGVRVSLFVDPDEAPVRWAARLGRRSRRALHRAVRARVRARPSAARRSFARYAAAAELAHALGLGVNAGHDLDLDNLALFRDAAAPRRGVDRPRAHQPRALGRASTASCADYLRRR